MMAFAALAVGTVVAVAWGVDFEGDAYREPEVDLTAGRGPNGEPPYMMDWSRPADQLDEEEEEEEEEGRKTSMANELPLVHTTQVVHKGSLGSFPPPTPLPPVVLLEPESPS